MLIPSSALLCLRQLTLLSLCFLCMSWNVFCVPDILYKQAVKPVEYFSLERSSSSLYQAIWMRASQTGIYLDQSLVATLLNFAWPLASNNLVARFVFVLCLDFQKHDGNLCPVCFAPCRVLRSRPLESDICLLCHLIGMQSLWQRTSIREDSWESGFPPCPCCHLRRGGIDVTAWFFLPWRITLPITDIASTSTRKHPCRWAATKFC